MGPFSLLQSSYIKGDENGATDAVELGNKDCASASRRYNFSYSEFKNRILGLFIWGLTTFKVLGDCRLSAGVRSMIRVFGVIRRSPSCTEVVDLFAKEEDGMERSAVTRYFENPFDHISVNGSGRFSACQTRSWPCMVSGIVGRWTGLSREGTTSGISASSVSFS